MLWFVCALSSKSSSAQHLTGPQSSSVEKWSHLGEAGPAVGGWVIGVSTLRKDGCSSPGSELGLVGLDRSQ